MHERTHRDPSYSIWTHATLMLHSWPTPRTELRLLSGTLQWVKQTVLQTQQDDLNSGLPVEDKRQPLESIGKTISLQRETEWIFLQWRYKTAKDEMIPVVCTVGAAGGRYLSWYPLLSYWSIQMSPRILLSWCNIWIIVLHWRYALKQTQCMAIK